ncbi:type VI secretion system tube protein Hcp [uncultured Sphaerotilus sp.]|uniref:Hcp family type VI secretion system effector n=1 Tax=uncultured Sphaerotilus sp. TaxID=474984 RepID=UPI0030CA1CCB
MSTDSYLHIQTKRAGKVKGECVAPGHADDIAVRSWSWGVSAPTAMGSVQATARRSYKNLTFVKGTDTASTALLSALVTNDEVKEASLMMRKAGEGQQDFLRLTLKNARITAVDIDSSEDGDVFERVSIAFTKVEIEYSPQQRTGQRGAAYVFNDDV